MRDFPGAKVMQISSLQRTPWFSTGCLAVSLVYHRTQHQEEKQSLFFFFLLDSSYLCPFHGAYDLVWGLFSTVLYKNRTRWINILNILKRKCCSWSWHCNKWFIHLWGKIVWNLNFRENKTCYMKSHEICLYASEFHIFTNIHLLLALYISK